MSRTHSPTVVEKTTVPDYAADDLLVKSCRAGCRKAEYLRDLIYMDLYGETFGEHVANSRRSIMGFKGPLVDQVGAKK